MTIPGAPAAGSVPTGNSFDKYGSESRVVRRLMHGFHNALDELFALADPGSVLDVGCGEGTITERWARRLPSGRVVGLDLEDPRLRAQWSRRRLANLEFMTGRATALPFAQDEFALVAAIESLEHVAEPERMLSEMARVAGSHLLVSVPREPLWRVLNLARGAYPADFGNTPGHVNHWSRGRLLELLRGYGRVVAVRTPLPWTLVLLRAG